MFNEVTCSNRESVNMGVTMVQGNVDSEPVLIFEFHQVSLSRQDALRLIFHRVLTKHASNNWRSAMEAEKIRVFENGVWKLQQLLEGVKSF